MKTEFNKETNKLRVFGNKESIEALTEHVQAKISNCKTTAYVKLSREHFLFLKKFVFGDTKWLAKVCATNQPTQKKEERKKQTNKTKIPRLILSLLNYFPGTGIRSRIKIFGSKLVIYSQGNTGKHENH